MNTIFVEAISISFHLVCFVAAWILIAIVLCNGWTVWQDGIAYVRKLHQIPCDRCTFFTGDYRLKCTVNPYKAFTEEAIDCLDYEPSNRSRICPCQKSMNQLLDRKIMLKN
jgi:hypothetical protein